RCATGGGPGSPASRRTSPTTDSGRAVALEAGPARRPRRGRETRPRRGRSGAGRSRLKLVLHVDGGARCHPGPAAIGVVVSGPDGEVLDEVAETIGVATNNVAEYRALLRGLERAGALGASEVEIVGDSELVAKQL